MCFSSDYVCSETPESARLFSADRAQGGALARANCICCTVAGQPRGCVHPALSCSLFFHALFQKDRKKTGISEEFLTMRPKKWQIFFASIRREMQWSSLGLEYARPNRFCKSQWHCADSVSCLSTYLVFKVAVAVYLLTGVMLNIIDLHALERGLEWPQSLIHRAKWFIYLTNWTLMILTAQALIAAVLAVEHQLFPPQGKSAGKMTNLHKWYWFLNNLCNVGSPAITLLFWTSVYNKDIHRLDFGNIHGHVMNTVLVVVDLMVTAHPVRLLHFYQPMILASTYSLFSIVYFFLGGTNKQGNSKIYPFLNWHKPDVALTYILSGCVLLMLIHVVMWMFYQLRRFIALQLGTLDYTDSKTEKVTVVFTMEEQMKENMQVTVAQP
ncbi:protein rolling stone-like [Neocloeon triangulifer]|uniref:protein rolling stone-like n=1 Tax=Neocloeon triangulifer TaxID=2078957 RepID=UPI00286F28E3|nr:protein rolling stone-like [Neocloeon triangulifer]